MNSAQRYTARLFVDDYVFPSLNYLDQVQYLNEFEDLRPSNPSRKYVLSGLLFQNSWILSRLTSLLPIGRCWYEVYRRLFCLFIRGLDVMCRRISLRISLEVLC